MLAAWKCSPDRGRRSRSRRLAGQAAEHLGHVRVLAVGHDQAVRLGPPGELVERLDDVSSFL